MADKNVMHVRIARWVREGKVGSAFPYTIEQSVYPSAVMFAMEYLGSYAQRVEAYINAHRSYIGEEAGMVREVTQRRIDECHAALVGPSMNALGVRLTEIPATIKEWLNGGIPIPAFPYKKGDAVFQISVDYAQRFLDGFLVDSEMKIKDMDINPVGRSNLVDFIRNRVTEARAAVDISLNPTNVCA